MILWVAALIIYFTSKVSGSVLNGAKVTFIVDVIDVGNLRKSNRLYSDNWINRKEVLKLPQ